MRIDYIAAVAALLFSTGPATADFGNDDHWESGFGMGVQEAIITRGPGNSIAVACDKGTASGNLTGITFTLGGTSVPGNFVMLGFDDTQPERYSIWENDIFSIPSNCRACAANFEEVINRLKGGSRVYVGSSDGQGATFSLKGSAQAIGDCPAAFWN